MCYSYFFAASLHASANKSPAHVVDSIDSISSSAPSQIMLVYLRA